MYIYIGKFQYLGNQTSKFFQFSLDYIQFILAITKIVETYPNLINLKTNIQEEEKTPYPMSSL